MSLPSSDTTEMNPVDKNQVTLTKGQEYFLLVEAIAEIPSAESIRKLTLIGQIKRITDQIAIVAAQGHSKAEIEGFTSRADELQKFFTEKGYRTVGPYSMTKGEWSPFRISWE
jgi:hypothetical protein